jgi:hypothetical protein
LESKEQSIVLSIRPYKEDMGQTLLNQPGIDHFVAHIDISQEPIATVGSLLVELQSDLAFHDERLVKPFSLQIEWLLIFWRVDPKIPNSPAIFQKNGISIIYPLDSDKFVCGYWGRECRHALAAFISGIAAFAGSTGQYPDEHQHRQPLAGPVHLPG